MADVYFVPPTMGVIIAAILTIVLMGLSAFASGSEIAFFSLSPSDMAEVNEAKTASDRNIKLLREDSERTLATILITNNFVNVTIIMLCNYIFSHTLRRESILVAISVAHRTLNLPSVTLWRDYAKSVQSSKPVGILS